MKVTSMRGVELDVGKFLAENEDMIALGNAMMNARGDIIGKGGKVVKTRAEISAEYHRTNPKAVKQVSIKNLESEIMSPQQAWGAAVDNAKKVEAAKAAKTEEDAPPVNKKRKIIDTDE